MWTSLKPIIPFTNITSKIYWGDCNTTVFCSLMIPEILFHSSHSVNWIHTIPSWKLYFYEINFLISISISSSVISFIDTPIMESCGVLFVPLLENVGRSRHKLSLSWVMHGSDVGYFCRSNCSSMDFTDFMSFSKAPSLASMITVWSSVDIMLCFPTNRVSFETNNVTHFLLKSRVAFTRNTALISSW